MLPRKPLPQWFSVGLFALATAMIPLIGQVRHRPVSLPGTLTELTVLLSQKAPSLSVISEVEEFPESGMYICTQPQQREQLQQLTRSALIIGTSRIGRWEGVIFCKKVGNFGLEEEELQRWGEHGMQIGPLLFFGDPALLQRIREVIFHHCGGKWYDSVPERPLAGVTVRPVELASKRHSQPGPVSSVSSNGC